MFNGVGIMILIIKNRNICNYRRSVFQIYINLMLDNVHYDFCK